MAVKRSSRLPRLWTNDVLRSIAPFFEGDLINVSGWDDRDKEGGYYRDYFTGVSEYYISNYGGARGLADAAQFTDYEIDLTAPLSEQFEARFDVVLNHTTLEHIWDMKTAFKNLCALTRDIVIVIVPFVQQVHFTPSYGDYWRFTPMALRHLFKENGLEVVYEAANRHRNAGIYVLAIGSRHPEKWKNRMPSLQPVDCLGEWIGETLWDRIRKKLSR